MTLKVRSPIVICLVLGTTSPAVAEVRYRRADSTSATAQLIDEVARCCVMQTAKYECRQSKLDALLDGQPVQLHTHSHYIVAEIRLTVPI